MEELNNLKHCLACEKPIKGRADKKYCNDNCRNTFHNNRKLLGSENNYVRNINITLLKNRRILEEMLSTDEDTTKTNKEKLLNLGFHFKYHTHTYTTMGGKTYWYCYEYGYLPLENDLYLIVKEKHRPG
jgi:predicted nucleic acid-binding Zn ribbon protein